MKICLFFLKITSTRKINSQKKDAGRQEVQYRLRGISIYKMFPLSRGDPGKLGVWESQDYLILFNIDYHVLLSFVQISLDVSVAKVLPGLEQLFNLQFLV